VSECALTALVRYCAGVCDRQHYLYFVQFTGTAWRLHSVPKLAHTEVVPLQLEGF